MNEETPKDEALDRRSESRHPPGKYYSVQFSIKALAFIYQFKIWDDSPSGLCILINEESDILKFLQVGDVVDMKYYVAEAVGTTHEFKTEIRHITKHDSGRFKGHCFVGLLMLDG